METTEHAQPRCDYIPMWSPPERRCHRPARFRVFRRHGAGIAPEYKDRCPLHAGRIFAPDIVAYWNKARSAWYPTD